MSNKVKWKQLLIVLMAQIQQCSIPAFTQTALCIFLQAQKMEKSSVFKQTKKNK